MLIDMTGKTIGRLTVIKRAENNRHKQAMWLCLCSCGKPTIVNGQILRENRTRSCGCLIGESIKLRQITHGSTKTRLYNIWRNIKQRCYNFKNTGYRNYGAKGIKVCDEWFSNYEAFQDWALANGYQDNLTIDRINNDEGYYPDNCRWITKEENSARSRQKAVRCINTGNIYPSAAKAAKSLGLSRHVVSYAIRYNYKAGGLRWEYV